MLWISICIDIIHMKLKYVVIGLIPLPNRITFFFFFVPNGTLFLYWVFVVTIVIVNIISKALNSSVANCKWWIRLRNVWDHYILFSVFIEEMVSCVVFVRGCMTVLQCLVRKEGLLGFVIDIKMTDVTDSFLLLLTHLKGYSYTISSRYGVLE